MIFPSLNIEWLVTSLFFVCFIGVLLIKGQDRFWFAPVGIWLLLFSFWCVGNVSNSNEVNSLKSQNFASANDNTGAEHFPQLEEAKKVKDDFNNKAIHLLGCQSFICLLWLLLGYKKTRLRFYKTGAISFFILGIIYLLIAGTKVI
jgi:uncharacterized ion transporter superfamily protein YfcC